MLIGGALSDRYDRRRLMIGADILRGFAMRHMGMLSISRQLQLWHMRRRHGARRIGERILQSRRRQRSSRTCCPRVTSRRRNALSGALRRLMTSPRSDRLSRGIVIAIFGPGPAFVIDAA